MEQYKSAEKSDAFVQGVNEPMALLCNEQQLVDIEHFCCNPYGMLGIDLTFNLGEFNVTPIVSTSTPTEFSHRKIPTEAWTSTCTLSEGIP